MSERVRVIVAVLGLYALLAFGLAQRAHTAPGGPAASHVTTVAVSGRANAHVSLASSGSVVVAVWSAARPEGPADIFAAVSPDGGRTFSSPVRVNDQPGEGTRINGEQPPRVAVGATPSGRSRVSVIWTAKGATGTVYNRLGGSACA